VAYPYSEDDVQLTSSGGLTRGMKNLLTPINYFEFMEYNELRVTPPPTGPNRCADIKEILARNFTTYFLVRSQRLDYLKSFCNIFHQKNMNALKKLKLNKNLKHFSAYNTYASTATVIS